MLLQDEDFAYDVVGNPTEIRDWRIPEEWPAGAKPVTRKVEYDDLYRAKRIQYEYAEGGDAWTSPFALENSEGGTSADPRRARPSPHISYADVGRVKEQTWDYDWLGNTARTTDNAQGFYDRSLGTIQNGPTSGPAYQLQSADIPEVSTSDRSGHLDTSYDAAGNLTRMRLRRNGLCLGGGSCWHNYDYRWDEAGRLIRARRWDGTYNDVNGPLPSGAAAADLSYQYDASDQRVLKQATHQAGA